MGLLQSVFNVSNRAVGALDKRIKKNDDKMWSRIDKVNHGKGLTTKAAGFVSLFAPASYLLIAEGALKGAFFAKRASTVKIAKAIGRPVDTSKLSKKLPRRSDRWTD